MSEPVNLERRFERSSAARSFGLIVYNHLQTISYSDMLKIATSFVAASNRMATMSGRISNLLKGMRWSFTRNDVPVFPPWMTDNFRQEERDGIDLDRCGYPVSAYETDISLVALILNSGCRGPSIGRDGNLNLLKHFLPPPVPVEEKAEEVECSSIIERDDEEGRSSLETIFEEDEEDFPQDVEEEVGWKPDEDGYTIEVFDIMALLPAPVVVVQDVELMPVIPEIVTVCDQFRLDEDSEDDYYLSELPVFGDEESTTSSVPSLLSSDCEDEENETEWEEVGVVLPFPRTLPSLRTPQHRFQSETPSLIQIAIANSAWYGRGLHLKTLRPAYYYSF
ncbi:hypothetical protein T439DRAFT_351903 [Meredithblackwellia eburnea MCA 4105]